MTGEVMDFSGVIRGGCDPLSTYVSDRWSHWIYSNPARDKWKESLEEVKTFLYALDTSTTSNSSAGNGHSTHRPKLTQIYDSLKANYTHAVFPNEDWAQFIPGDASAASVDVKRKLEGFLRDRHKLSGFYPVADKLLDDWIIGGNTYCEVEFVDEQVGDDPSKHGYIGPRPKRINPYRIAWNYNAASFRESPKIVQDILTLGDIAERVQNQRLPVEYRDVLDRSLQFRGWLSSHGTDIAESFLEEDFTGFGSRGDYFFGDNVETLTFYGSFYDKETGILHSNRKIVVVDRTWVLINEEIDTWDGKPHIYHSSWRDRPGSLLGMGPLENLVGMQYMIDHLENIKADAFDKMVDPDRVLQGIDDMVHREDGGIDYHIYESGQVQHLNPDTEILNADLQIDRLEAKMEEYAGAPREAMGIRTPGEKTKFEVGQLMNAAGRIFQSKIQKFEIELIDPLINAEVEVTKSNLNTSIPTLVDTDVTVVFQSIVADDLKLNGRMIPIGARHFAKQAQLVQELANFQNIIATDPEILVHFPADKLALAWNSLMGFGSREGIYERFGRVAERVEMQQQQQAAQSAIDATAAADPETNPMTME